MPWYQAYDPTGNWLVSALLASLPVIVLLGSLAFFRIKAHQAALLGLASAFIIVLSVFRMPLSKCLAVALYGALFGLFPIGWIILNVIFLYNLTDSRGYFNILQQSLASITRDSRLLLLLIAFSFGAFFEGAAGFGTPVAVTAAILIGLGFTPLAASGLSLLANTAPVAFGALGTPIIALAGVTGLDIFKLSAMVGRQLPLFSILVPFWLIWAFAGRKGMLEIWPAALVAGGLFAIPQFFVSNFHGPWLVDIVASVISLFGLIAFLRVWQPKRIRELSKKEVKGDGKDFPISLTRRQIFEAWLPWAILSVTVFLWGIPQVKSWLDSISSFRIPVPGVHGLIYRTPPVVASAEAEPAIYTFNWLSFTGTAIFLAALLSGIAMGVRWREASRLWLSTLKRVRFSLLTVAAMLSLGYVTRFSGLDATMGLAFARTGFLYPFFGTMLGWLGVALTGSDTSSNVLFGSLQKITANQVGISPLLMAAANSSGGVMGKMVDAQSIVVASTATKWYGHEGAILRYVFFHSLVLASLVGILVFLQAYVFPFTLLVIK